MSGVLVHMEHYLGTMTVACRAVRAKSQGGDELPFHLVTYPDPARAPARTYSTLGLSLHVLEQHGGQLRQEVIMCAQPGVRALEWLNYLGERLLDSHRAFERGEATPSFGSLSPNSTVSGFVLTQPVYWPDGLATLEGTDPPVAVVWAVPLTPAELSFVAGHGWSALEDLFIREQPDVTDWNRPTVHGVH